MEEQEKKVSWLFAQLGTLSTHGFPSLLLCHVVEMFQ